MRAEFATRSKTRTFPAPPATSLLSLIFLMSCWGGGGGQRARIVEKLQTVSCFQTFFISLSSQCLGLPTAKGFVLTAPLF